MLGPLFVRAEEGDLSGIVVIGARTSSTGRREDGTGSSTTRFRKERASTREAWVEGLQQNEENRSNLALVNTGEVDDSPSVFHLEIYNGETGMLEQTVATKPIAGSGLASDRRGPAAEPRTGDPAGVHPDREDVGGEPVSGLRSGQRRRGARRAA